MLSKKVIKDIESLRLKKHRDTSGLFVAEGPKVVEELLQALPQQCVAVYALEAWAGKYKNSEVVSEAELQRISALKTPNQVVAVFRQWESREPDARQFTLYLDTLQDPGNLGTIIRIADWFGVQNIVCSAGCAELYNPKVVQATMASLARVNVYYDQTGDWLQKQRVPVYAATLHGKSLYEMEKVHTGILLIGNESRGLCDALIRCATQAVTIPQKGRAESLNAAVATGIILSHLLP